MAVTGRTALGAYALVGALAFAPRAHSQAAPQPPSPTAQQAPPRAPPQTPSATASADPAVSVEQAARGFFTEGVAALDDGRYADALAAFRRSWALRRSAAVAMNMAFALRGLGRSAEAHRRYTDFLSIARGDTLTRYEAAVRHNLDELAPRVALVTVTVAPANAQVTLEPPAAGSSDLPLDSAGSSTELAFDPGAYQLRVTAPGFLPVVRTVQLAAGQRLRLPLALAPVPLVEPPRPPPPRPPSLVTRWWFWGAVGLGVAGVATAVGLGASAASAPACTPAPQDGSWSVCF